MKPIKLRSLFEFNHARYIGHYRQSFLGRRSVGITRSRKKKKIS